jgi:hypothetical protein
MCTPCRVGTRSFAHTAAPLGVGHHTEGRADACASWLYTCQSAIVADVARLKHRIMSGWCIGNATRVPKPLSMSACTCGVTPNAMQAMQSERRVLLRSTVQKVELLLCRVRTGGRAGTRRKRWTCKCKKHVDGSNNTANVQGCCARRQICRGASLLQGQIQMFLHQKRETLVGRIQTRCAQ